MDESIRERVVRLIHEMRNRTTDRGSTPGEAAAFAAKVAEWIEKYQIDEAELRRATNSTDSAPDIEVCENTLRTGKKVFNPGEAQVVNSLALGMCCKVILLHNNYDGQTEAVYGITGDSLDADYVCQVAVTLIPALTTMAKLEGVEHGYEKAGLVRWANQYLTGAGVEIFNRLYNERKQRSETKQAASMGALMCITGESIAIVKRTAVAKAFAAKYPKTIETNSRSEYDRAAHERGREAGKRVGLNVALEG